MKKFFFIAAMCLLIASLGVCCTQPKPKFEYHQFKWELAGNVQRAVEMLSLATQEDLNHALVEMFKDNNVKGMRILLEVGADPNTTYKDQPLLIVSLEWMKVMFGFDKEGIKRAKTLLNAGANPNCIATRNYKYPGWYGKGETPLHLVARYEDIELAELLLDAGADPNAISPRRNLTPLEVFIYESKTKRVYEKGVEFTNLLIRYGAEIKKVKDDFTPLMHAVSWVRMDVVEALISAGVDVNRAGWHDWTPLHINATNMDCWGSYDVGTPEKIRELLLSAGADPQLKDELGRTPAELSKLSTLQRQCEYKIYKGEEYKKNCQ